MELFKSPSELYRFGKAAGKRFFLALLLINIVTGFHPRKQQVVPQKIEKKQIIVKELKKKVRK